jgi:hypothetical protein
MALRRDEKDPGQPGQQEIDEWQKNRSDQNSARGDWPSLGSWRSRSAVRDFERAVALSSNDYLIMGKLDRPEWRKGMQDPLSIQEMVEHLHDFKEVVTFQRTYV